jgi:sec-independent protein translocase protein TatA
MLEATPESMGDTEDIMFSGLESPFHLLIVLVIAVLVLGPKRIPEVARSLGSGIRHFKSSLSGEDSVPAENDVSTEAEHTLEPNPADDLRPK